MNASIKRRTGLAAFATALVAFLGCASSAKNLSHPQTPTAVSNPQLDADYPTREIRLIVPFPAGGGADSWGRFLADKLAALLHQPFLVENAPGYGGNRGTELASRAAADGYTLLLGSVGPLIVHPYTYNNLPFDAEKDLAPIGLFESSPILLLVHPEVRASSVMELVALAKAEPGGLSFATNGNGSPEQVAGELFGRLAGVHLRDVPYDGAGPARTNLSKGKVTMMFDPSKAAMEAVRQGAQRPLAIADMQRSPRLPTVPTFRELGYPELEMRIWIGLFGPRGVPSAVVTKLNATVRTLLEDPAVREAIEEVGGQPMPMTFEGLAAFLTVERSKWRRLVTDAGIRRVDGPL